jgi:hypothetical protein
LVLGAGASMPYGFPSGLALKARIWSSIERFFGRGDSGGHVDKELGQRLIDAGFHKDDLDQFGTALKRSPRRSIDAFLENQPDFDKIGRAAIVAALSPLESTSPINTPGKQIDDDWYEHFYNKLPGGMEALAAFRFGVVTFNYDRSFETYLEQAVRDDYRVSPERALSALQGMRVVHFYGSLGTQPFGSQLHGDQLLQAAEAIEIVRQRDAEYRGVDSARTLIQSASKIVFLGFGYDRTNVARLAISNDWPTGSMGFVFLHPNPPAKLVTGSVYGLTPHEVKEVHGMFKVEAQFRVRWNGMQCRQFLRETLALSSIPRRRLQDELS